MQADDLRARIERLDDRDVWWTEAAKVATTYANMWMDEAVNQRERADELARLIRNRGEIEELRPKGAVTRGEIDKAIRDAGNGFFDERLDAIVDVVWGLIGDVDVAEADPVEEKAERMAHDAFACQLDNLAPKTQDIVRMAARHALGDTA